MAAVSAVAHALVPAHIIVSPTHHVRVLLDQSPLDPFWSSFHQHFPGQRLHLGLAWGGSPQGFGHPEGGAAGFAWGKRWR